MMTCHENCWCPSCHEKRRISLKDVQLHELREWEECLRSQINDCHTQLDLKDRQIEALKEQICRYRNEPPPSAIPEPPDFTPNPHYRKTLDLEQRVIALEKRERIGGGPC